jgi:hypothetical protein
MEQVSISGSPGQSLKMHWVGAEDFMVEVGVPGFSGQVTASVFHVGSPARFFRWMADHWRGWQGEARWEDLEEHVRFTGAMDSLGHVSLRVRLLDSTFTHSLDVVLNVDAGQLEGISRSVSAMFTDGEPRTPSP